MKLFKKLLVFSLVLSLLLTTLPVQFISASAAEADEAKLQLMLDLGIYSLNDDMEYYNENLTREETATLLSVFYGLTEDSYPVETGLEDVVKNATSGHISMMLSHKIMSTYSDGLFRPLTYVTVDATIKMFVVMLGYQQVAEAKGGYPEGYYAVACELKLLDGLLGIERSGNITRGEFTKLLYNAIHTPIMPVTGLYRVEGYKKDKDQEATLLTENLHIYQDKGVVTALPYMELGYGEGAGVDQVCIDNIKYNYSADLYEQFGKKVKIYYLQTEDDLRGTILSLTPDKDNDTVTVDAEDIVSFANGRFTYMDDDRATSIDLPSDFLLLFNGRPMAYYQPGHLTPKQGSVRLCDSDGDGTYDVVVVTYETDYHVENIIEKDGSISIVDVNGQKNNRQVIQINEDDFCVVTDRNVPYSLDKIQKDDILSIAADNIDIATGEVQPGSTVFRIRRTSNKVVGVLTTIDSTSIGIDEKKYELNEALASRISSLKVGSSYTFYLNYKGMVADFSYDIATQQYALLIDGTSQGAGLSEKTAQLRLYKTDGSFVIYDCAKNMKIDGYNKKQYLDVIDYLKKSSVNFAATTGMTLPTNGVWQLVKYTVNDVGEINSIDTLSTNLVVGENDLTHTYTTPNADNLWSDGTLYNASSQVRNTISTDATIFVLNSALDSDACYGLMPYSHMGRLTEVQHYFDADELGVSKIMFRMGTPSSMSRDSYENIMVYEKTIYAADAMGVPQTVMCGALLMAGTRVQLPLENDALLTSEGISPGDIVQYVEKNGIVTEVKKGLSRFGGGEITDAPNWSGQFGQLSDLKYGKVLNYNDAYIRFSYETSTTPVEETLRSRYIGEKVYIFDTQKNKLIQSSIPEIRSADKYGIDEADTFAGLYVNDAVRALVLYR